MELALDSLNLKPKLDSRHWILCATIRSVASTGVAHHSHSRVSP
jgi:hypothetical protein